METLGGKEWAEYDILLPEKMPFASAHDIAETLQYCCEGGEFQYDWRRAALIFVGINEVDRAFVTTDCEYLSKSWHFHLLITQPLARHHPRTNGACN